MLCLVCPKDLPVRAHAWSVSTGVLYLVCWVPKNLIVGYVLDLSTGVLCLVSQKGTDRAVDLLDPISSSTLCLVCPNNLQWGKVLGPISSGVVSGHVLGHPFLGCS